MKYVLVQWPESQYLMYHERFHECFLIQDIEGHDEVGSCAYMCPEDLWEEISSTPHPEPDDDSPAIDVLRKSGELSTRAYRTITILCAWKHAKCTTLKEFALRFSKLDLRKTRNCGSVTINEVDDLIWKYCGIRWRRE